MRAVLSLASQPQQRHVTQPHEKHQRPTLTEEGTRGRVQDEEPSAAALESSTHTPRIHVLRLTDSAAMPLLNRANAAMGKAITPEGVTVNRVTVGSCPHYVMFDAETVVRGDTRLKVAPPLRDAPNRRRLWAALLDGSVAMLASDHTPATLEERAGSFFDAFTGISGLQFTLPATWTEGREHGATLRNLSTWLSEEPAKLSGIWTQKGSIEEGKDADLVVWRPESRTDTAAVFHRQPGSPYEDLSLYGRVMETVLRGRVVFRDGSPPLSTCGAPILRAEGSRAQHETGGSDVLGAGPGA